jgi:hypothetical protein
MRVLLLLLFVAPIAQAQIVDSTGFDRLRAIEGWIGQPSDVLSEYMGEPDEAAYDSIIGVTLWTYTTMGMVEGEPTKLLGYHQFALLNGRVAGINSRWFGDADDSKALHEQSIAYMGEDGRSVTRMATTAFTPAGRTSRRGDNLWTSDFVANGMDSNATLLVGDAGYRGCLLNAQHEAKRVEAKFGVVLSDSTGGPRFSPAK